MRILHHLDQALPLMDKSRKFHYQAHTTCDSIWGGHANFIWGIQLAVIGKA